MHYRMYTNNAQLANTSGTYRDGCRSALLFVIGCIRARDARVTWNNTAILPPIRVTSVNQRHEEIRGTIYRA